MSGRALAERMTSVVVTGRNTRNSQPVGAGVNDGGGASAVEARTPATFASKN